MWRISSNGCLNIVSEGPVVALMRQGQAHEAVWAVTRACHLGGVRLLSHARMAKRGRGARSVDSLKAAVWRISTAGPLNIVSEGSVVALMRQGQANEARCEMHASISTDNCFRPYLYLGEHAS